MGNNNYRNGISTIYMDKADKNPMVIFNDSIALRYSSSFEFVFLFYNDDNLEFNQFL